MVGWTGISQMDLTLLIFDYIRVRTDESSWHPIKPRETPLHFQYITKISSTLQNKLHESVPVFYHDWGWGLNRRAHQRF